MVPKNCCEPRNTFFVLILTVNLLSGDCTKFDWELRLDLFERTGWWAGVRTKKRTLVTIAVLFPSRLFSERQVYLARVKLGFTVKRVSKVFLG